MKDTICPNFRTQEAFNMSGRYNFRARQPVIFMAPQGALNRPLILRSMALPSGALGPHSAEALTVTSPNLGPVVPQERDSAWDHADPFQQNMNNATIFCGSFPEYRMWEGSAFFEKRENGSALIYSAHKLNMLEFGRTELYNEVSRGGCLKPGQYEDLKTRLRQVHGAYEEFSEKFRDAALRLNPLNTIRALHAAGNEKELEVIIRDKMNCVAIEALKQLDGSCLLRYSVPFAAGGTIPVLNSEGDNLHEVVPGIVGQGDMGVFNGLTGLLEIAVESKFEEILAHWLGTRKAVNLLLQGWAFMTGRDSTFLMLLQKTGYIVIWRVDEVVDGVRRSEYRMWPDRAYAPFSDSANLAKFHELLGEFSRISAARDVEANLMDLGTGGDQDILVEAGALAENVPEQVSSSAEAVSIDSPVRTSAANSNSQTSRRWLVKAGDKEFPLMAFDVRTHLTPEQLSDLLVMKRQDRDLEEFTFQL